MDFGEEIRDFLIESSENLATLDQDIVELEKNPTDDKLIASVFRTIHTIKGTSGFFGFEILCGITHVTENILGQVREKQRPLTPALVSMVLETVDAVRAVLTNVEANGTEGADIYQDLRQRLDDVYHYRDSAPASAPAEAASGEAAAPTEVTVAKPAEAEARPSAAEQSAPEAEALASEDPIDPEDLPLPAVEVDLPAASQSAPEAHPAAPAAPHSPIPAATVSTPVPVARYSAPAAPPVPAAAEGEAPKRGADDSAANSTIRVDVRLLDKLMNLVGELVLARNQILQGSAASSSGTAQRLNLITSELQESVMRTRMQPIGVVWNKLPRVVRDLASELGKKIAIKMEGAETELDKTIIEAIKDPLTHIVRNSCDHGVERPDIRLGKGKPPDGTVWLRAFHEGGHVNIEISDDGAGIDPEKVKAKAVQKGLVRPEQVAMMSEWEALRLIFLPGFSTAEKVTNISGRGVGMDVVKTNIEKIGGSVDLCNRPEGGSTIKIKIPLTLAIIPGLVVSVYTQQEDDATRREHRFVIPQANLLELVRLESEKDRKQIEKIRGAQVYRRRGKLLPLTYLSQVLELPSQRHDDDVLNIVIVQAEDTAFGVVVDQVLDTQEIVVKALGKQLKSLDCYIGATIMGDGKISLILDVAGIAKLAQLLSQQSERGKLEAKSGGALDSRQMLLLFSAGRFQRLVLPLSMVARLEEFPGSDVEYAAGVPVLRYREAILPLVSMGGLLDQSGSNAGMDGDSLQVLVFNDGDRSIGMVVDEILDIVDNAVTVKRAGSTFGLLGSGVVGGKVTDFVDLGALLEAARNSTAGYLSGGIEKGRLLLVVEPKKIARGSLRGYLEIHGHQVAEAASLDAAVKLLEQTPVDLVLSALDLGDHRGAELVRAMRGRRGMERTPVLGLASSGSAEIDSPAPFDKVVPADDREAILQAVRALTQGAPDREPSAMEYAL